MTLGAPSWLHLLWLMLPLVAGLFYASAARGRALKQIFAPAVLARTVPPGLERRRAWRSTLACIGLALCMIAAAQPRWGFTWQDLRSEGVEVVLALDVSRSMDARDVDPSRLGRAQREVLDLMEMLRGDRVGLVIFAAGAYPRIPMTMDHDILRTVVRALDSQILQAQGSSIAAALEEALKMFNEERKADRAVILISDGESWDDSLQTSLDAAVEAEVRVYAVGVGTPEGAPIPEEGGGFKTDRSGQVVLSRLDESALKEVASRTGGAYVRSSASADDVKELAAEMHRAMGNKNTQTSREKVWDERFQWPLAAGLGLLLIAALLGDTPLKEPEPAARRSRRARGVSG